MDQTLLNFGNELADMMDQGGKSDILPAGSYNAFISGIKKTTLDDIFVTFTFENNEKYNKYTSRETFWISSPMDSDRKKKQFKRMMMMAVLAGVAQDDLRKVGLNALLNKRIVLNTEIKEFEKKNKETGLKEAVKENQIVSFSKFEEKKNSVNINTNAGFEKKPSWM